VSLLYLDDVGDIFFRNVGNFLPGYTVSNPKSELTFLVFPAVARCTNLSSSADCPVSNSRTRVNTELEEIWKETHGTEYVQLSADVSGVASYQVP
jgi:hypothetical protein